MDEHEAGKAKAEQFARDLARSLKQDDSATSFLWWTGEQSQSGRADLTDTPPLVLRMYRGNSWRAVEFSASDIDACAEKPDALKKYESEIAQSLMEL
jgi:hypothetical protein